MKEARPMICDGCQYDLRGVGMVLLTCKRALAPLDGDSIRCSGCRWISS